VASKAGISTNARERARANRADKTAVAHAREKANEDDLAAFLTLDADVEGAAATRDAAIAAAAAYDSAVATTRAAQAAKVRAMLARGETVVDVAELTGWTAKQVRTAAKPATTTPATDGPAAPAEQAS